MMGREEKALCCYVTKATCSLVAYLRFERPKMSGDFHGSVRKAIEVAYWSANDGLPPPWDGFAGRSLKHLLESNPSWSLRDWITCVENRFASEVNLSQNPIRWIKTLPDYRRVPPDKYGKPKKVNVEKTIDDYWEARGKDQNG